MLVRIFEEGDQIFRLNGQFLVGDPVGIDRSDFDGIACGTLCLR